jgi:NAD(P)H-nitrite reductase large subunit
MPAWLDKFSSQALEEILISRGIGVILDRNVSEILGNGEVNAVKIDSGKVFAADLVLVTENLRPNVDFLKESNLTIEQGITVDKRLKTNIDAVSAAGDVVQFKNQDWLKDAQGYGWDECLKQGKTLASNILGQDAKYEASRSIYDFSYRDLNISSWGELNSLTADEQLYHRLPNQAFKLFNLKENKIIGFVLINDVQERDKFLELAKNQTDISSMKFETNREPQKERITNG